MSVPTVAERAAAATDWSGLADAVAGCTECAELAQTRTRTVAGVLPGTARTGPLLMLVGEAPGAQEDLAGLPFVGRSGALLDTLLEQVGVARADVAVANVLKCRPPSNRSPRRGEVVACRPWLERQLAIARPAVVVAMGTTAVTWFFGAGSRIGALRGKPLERDGALVMATYHPSAALRFGPRGMPMAALRDDLAAAADAARRAGS